MQKLLLQFLSCSSLVGLLACPVAAQQNIESYTTTIGVEDRRNSSGTALTGIAQILAQDRANVHRFAIRHDGDETDRIFQTVDMRARFADLLERGSLGPGVDEAIAGGGVLRLSIQVYGSGNSPDYVIVTLADTTMADAADTVAMGSDPLDMGESTEIAGVAGEVTDPDSIAGPVDEESPEDLRQASAQSAETGWIMLGAPAPYRARMIYIRQDQPIYSLTCKLGAPRDVQQWINGQPSEERIDLVGPSGSVGLSVIDHSLSPRITFRFFRNDHAVRLISDGIDLPEFQWPEFNTAYLAFHKSCQRGYSPGARPTYNCAVPQNPEARAVCGTPDLARLQRETVERYEHFTRDIAAIDQEAIEIWNVYSGHMDALETCSNHRNDECYATAYRQFLGELVRRGDAGAPPIPTLAEALPDAQIQAELLQHGFSAGRGLGRMAELHFTEAQLGDRTLFVVLHDVPQDQALDPIDERLLFAAAELAGDLTPPAQVRLYHVVKGHPVPPGAAGEAGIPNVTDTRLSISWSNNDRDTLLVRFGEDRWANAVSARDLLSQLAERAEASQDYSERVAAALGQMRDDIDASARVTETEKAEAAAQAGLVYRNPAFWSTFDYVDTVRIFEGGQTSPILGLRYLAGWLAAHGSICSPTDEPMRMIDWPDAPAIRQILADAPEADYFPEDRALAVRESYADLFEIAVQPALLNENAVSRSMQDPLIAQRIVGAERDAARLLRMSGCNSATASQFELNLIRLLRGAPSLQAAGLSVDHATRESDAPPR